MSSKIITVVGITGNQGASVAEAFINAPGWKVRGISRDTSKESAKKWSNRGVEMFAADLGDVDALKKAFKGSHAIFGVTDFWAQMRLESNQQKAQKEGKTVNQIAYDVEVQQGKNLADAVHATVDSLEVLVLSTLGDSVKWSHGKITGNYHFEAKWRAVEYIEQTYPDLYKKLSMFQPASFLGGLDMMFKPRQMEDGSLILALPINADSKVPWYDANKDSGKIVKALVEAGPGKNVMGYGSWASLNDIAQIWSEKVGKPVKVVRSSVEDLAKMIPGGSGQELGDMCEYMSSPGYYGGDEAVKAMNLIRPEDIGVTGLVTVHDHLKDMTL